MSRDKEGELSSKAAGYMDLRFRRKVIAGNNGSGGNQSL